MIEREFRRQSPDRSAEIRWENRHDPDAIRVIDNDPGSPRNVIPAEEVFGKMRKVNRKNAQRMRRKQRTVLRRGHLRLLRLLPECEITSGNIIDLRERR
jgi:hypothetical protein